MITPGPAVPGLFNIDPFGTSSVLEVQVKQRGNALLSEGILLLPLLPLLSG